jgi:hypothetical protein
VQIRVVVICCCLVAAVAVVLTRIVDLSFHPHGTASSVAGASTVDPAVPGAGVGGSTADGDSAKAADDDSGTASAGTTDAAGGGGGTVTGGNDQQQGGNSVIATQLSLTPGPVVTTPPPGATPSPTAGAPTPTPSAIPPVVSYEAESSRNTLTGTRTYICPPCLGGKKVGDVGDGTVLAFNKVNIAQAGTVTLTIAYVNGDVAARHAQLSVGGGSAQWLTFAPTGDWNTVSTLTVRVASRAGDNTIQLGNATDMAPDFDRLTVREGA